MNFVMSVFYGFVMTLCLFVGTSARSQSRRTGCPMMQTVRNFDQTKYMGIWYQYSTSNVFVKPYVKCSMYNWSALTNGNFERIPQALVNGTKKHALTIARVRNSSEPERFQLSFPKNPKIPKRNHLILGTDYVSYAVEYSCHIDNSRIEGVWILTRERNPPEWVISDALRVVEIHGLNRTQFIKDDQTGCEIMDGKSNSTETTTTKTTTTEATIIETTTTETITTESNPIASNPTESNRIELNSTESNPIIPNLTKSNSSESNQVESNPIVSNPIKLNLNDLINLIRLGSIRLDSSPIGSKNDFELTQLSDDIIAEIEIPFESDNDLELKQLINNGITEIEIPENEQLIDLEADIIV